MGWRQFLNPPCGGKGELASATGRNYGNEAGDSEAEFVIFGSKESGHFQEQLKPLFGLSLGYSMSLLKMLVWFWTVENGGQDPPVLRKEGWKCHGSRNGRQMCPAEETSHEAIGT